MAESRQTPEERLADYKRQIDAAKARMGTDVPYKLQQLGVPADAIMRSRQPLHTGAISAAMRFRDADRSLFSVLLLAGERGVGKTVAAAWVLGKAAGEYAWNEMASGGVQHPPFVWAHASEVTSETDFGRVSPEWLEGLKRCRLLVLDDLGREGTPVGRTALRDVLVTRLEHRRPTVLTSNLKLDELRREYGESWFVRLATAAIAPDLRDEKSLRVRTSKPNHKPQPGATP